MGMVAFSRRIASAFVVFCGRWGAVSQHARECQVSRQRIYRESNDVKSQVEGTVWQGERQALEEELQHWRQANEQQQQRLDRAIVLDKDKQVEFAVTGQALGVSLAVLRALLEVLQRDAVQRDAVPSVAQLGRWTKQAGEKAGQHLLVLDEAVRGQVRQALADEIYASDPVLMVVEPESLCWLSGRKVTRAGLTGQAWSEALGALPALEQVTCDAGPSLHAGIKQLNASRRQAGVAELAEQLDHFHSLWGGGVAVAGVEKKLRGALRRAETLQAQLEQRRRNGQTLNGLCSRTRAAWTKAERLMDRWSQLQQLWQKVKDALPLVTPEGELNTRARAEAILNEALPQLPETFAKSSHLLRRRQVLTYLDRVHERLQALQAPAAIRQAAVRQETLRQRPELWRGEGVSAAALRGVLLACAVVLHQAGSLGTQMVQQVRSIFRESWRASSLVECINSVLRMQQARHRKLTQGLLDLKRLYWNCHVFRTGRRRGTSPYQRIGLPWPRDLPWWEILKMPPEQLCEKLSAQRLAT